MRWVPLLAAVLAVSAAVPAAAAPCGVPLVANDSSRRRLPPLESDSPECSTLVGIPGVYAKLLAVAKLGDVPLAVVDDTEIVNAYYDKAGVLFTRAMLRGRPSPDVLIMVSAHELGHGVQDKSGVSAWRNQPFDEYNKRTAGTTWTREAWEASPEHREFLKRSRRYEAHADAIGQELLSAAGMNNTMFAGGAAQFFGCGGMEALYGSDETHPLGPQRVVNAAYTQTAARDAADRSRKAESAAAAIAAGFVSGKDAGAVGAGASVYRPAASIGDFDEGGRLRVAQKAARSLRIDVPPPDAGPVRTLLQNAAVSVVDFYVADPFERAVARLSSPENTGRDILRACRGGKAPEIGEDFSTIDWWRRIAADLTRRAVVRVPEAGKTATLGVPG